MEKIDISIIVPVFNGEAYLATLLDSLSSQSGVSFEIIAINDGSSDGSAAILTDRARRHSFLRVIHQPNQGLSIARNQGIAQAKGQWVAFADCDDWLAPNALQIWLQQATEQQLDLLIGNGYRFCGEPTQQSVKPLLPEQRWQKTLTGKQWIIHSVAQNNWLHFCWLQLIRRELIQAHQLTFTPHQLHEDILWTTRLALAAQRVNYCPEPLYGYRTAPHSITRKHCFHLRMLRAASYLDIISELVRIAAQSEPVLSKALLRHANRESGQLLGLTRWQTRTCAERSQLARRFKELGLEMPLIRGAIGLRDFWRALRCIIIFRRYARQKPSLKADKRVCHRGSWPDA
ncbi:MULTISPECIES: glycosyltransferase [Yersinia]|nr:MULTISPECIES: glycosyltransferase [Yersinia]OWF85857.1 glycosyl transferase [Yersinia entomophaga]